MTVLFNDAIAHTLVIVTIRLEGIRRTNRLSITTKCAKAGLVVCVLTTLSTYSIHEGHVLWKSCAHHFSALENTVSKVKVPSTIT